MKFYIDLDGPILNIKEKCWQVHCRVVKELGGKVKGDIDRYWVQKRSCIKRTVILDECGINPFFEAEYLKKFTSIVETKRYAAYDKIQEGAEEVLKLLSSESELVLVTIRKDPEATREELQSLQLINYFSNLLIGGELPGESGAQSKERMVRKEIKKTHSAGKIFIGDSEQEILAAKSLGIPSIVVLNGLRTRERLEAYTPTHIIKDITFFPKLLSEISL